MDQATMQGIIDAVLCGTGSVPSGEPYLIKGTWYVPFKNPKAGELLAWIMDRRVVTSADRRRAIQDLEEGIGLAIAQS